MFHNLKAIDKAKHRAVDLIGANDNFNRTNKTEEIQILKILNQLLASMIRFKEIIIK